MRIIRYDFDSVKGFSSKSVVKLCMARKADYDYLYKILLIGGLNVGKSNLMERYVENAFTDRYGPGLDFNIKTEKIRGKIFKLQIWDTGGQQRWDSINSSYYKGSHGIIIVYSITDGYSFKEVTTRFLTNIKTYAPENVLTLLVGSKCDEEDKREVSTDEGQRLAEKYNMNFFETSAKKNINVTEAFRAIIEAIYVKNQGIQCKEASIIKTGSAYTKNDGIFSRWKKEYLQLWSDPKLSFYDPDINEQKDDIILGDINIKNIVSSTKIYDSNHHGFVRSLCSF